MMFFNNYFIKKTKQQTNKLSNLILIFVCYECIETINL